MLFELSEDQALVRESVLRFASERVRPSAPQWDRAAEIPGDVWAELEDLGLFGALVVEELGGVGLDVYTAALSIEALGQADASIAFVVANQMVASALVAQFGSIDRHGESLARLVAGKYRAAWVPAQDGLRLKGATVTGSSGWVHGARTADVVLIRADSDEVLVRSPEQAVMGRDDTGGGLGLRAAGCCRLHFGGVHLDLLPSPAGRVGAALLSVLRAAAATGLAASALARCRDYALERQQFGRPIADFQAIQWKLADMATAVDAASLLVAQAASAWDGSDASDARAARAETYATETAVFAAYEAIQIFGGNGFIREYGVERALRDAQMLQVLAQGTAASLT